MYQEHVKEKERKMSMRNTYMVCELATLEKWMPRGQYQWAHCPVFVSWSTTTRGSVYIQGLLDKLCTCRRRVSYMVVHTWTRTSMFPQNQVTTWNVQLLLALKKKTKKQLDIAIVLTIEENIVENDCQRLQSGNWQFKYSTNRHTDTQADRHTYIHTDKQTNT